MAAPSTAELRDKFATHAMAVLIAESKTAAPREVARHAYDYAEAKLAERRARFDERQARGKS